MASPNPQHPLSRTASEFASSVDLRATKTSLAIGERHAHRTIRIRNLNHFYGDGETRKQVLFHNHFDAYEGQIVIMTGPSGSGKTTLLTLIGTLRSVQDGSLQVLDREMLDATAEERVAARRDIGFIFQAHNLFASLTAIQNVRMAMELFKFSEKEMHDRAAGLLERLGLGQRMHYKPDRLSGGQKQRVAIARGLAHNPKIILADEPTAALDEQSGRQVVELLREMASKQRKTIILVTHDNRILDVADRIVNMVDGNIKSDVVVHEARVIVEFLRKVELFKNLSVSTLASIADKMWSEQLGRNETVIRQGELSKNFYIVRRGELEVMREQDGEERRLAFLAEGDCFGEEALLRDQPRSATVRTMQPSLLYVLGERDFRAALAASESLRDELQKVLFERQ